MRSRRGKDQGELVKEMSVTAARTLYELVSVSPRGKKMLAGYALRKSRKGLLAMVSKNGQAWADATGTEELTFVKSGAEATMGRWRFYFSGRTERDAMDEGELSWFKDVV